MIQRKNRPTVHIEDWSIIGDYLYGTVVDHPKFPKNTQVKTSRIVAYPFQPTKGDTITTLNTEYVLGAPKS